MFEVSELLLGSEGALAASVALSVLTKFVVQGIASAWLPPYFAAGRLDKKLLLDEGVELGLSTLLIALLKASSLHISFKKELSLGRDLAILLITAVCLAWDI